MKMVESLRKGLEVMEAFTAARPKLRLQEVTDLTGLPKATTYRMLRTLISLGYVRYDSVSAYFELRPRVMALGFTVLSSLDLRDTSQPFLEDFSRASGQNVNLGILDGLEVVYVGRVKQHSNLDLDLSVGSRLPAVVSSMGRAILAHTPGPRLDEFIGRLLEDEQYAEMVGPDGSILREKLAQARQDGYALNDQETFSGLRAAGAPVFNAQGEVEGAVSVAVFTQITSREELLEEMVPRLLQTARDISQARGYLGA